MYDVLIIGAGPGGNMAASRLASQGYKVAVVDYRKNIGDKLCTGIIGIECAKKYPPEMHHVYREAASAVIVSPGGIRYGISRMDSQALILNRSEYIKSFADSAQSFGADYELEKRVTNIEVSKERVLVETRGRSGNRHSIGAKILIIASGFGSPLLSMVGLSRKRHDDYLVGVQMEVLSTNLEETEVYTGSQLGRGSFSWVVPLTDSRSLVGMVSRRSKNFQLNSSILGLKKKIPIRRILSGPKQWGIPIRPVERTFTDRVLVVGDAAGQVKPTTGGGIYYSLVAGELASEVTSDALAKEEYSARFLSLYESKWRSAFGKELRLGYHTRTLYEHLSDGQIEQLLKEILSSKFFKELINSNDFSFDWHSGIILKALKQQEFFGLIKTLGPSVAPFLGRILSDYKI